MNNNDKKNISHRVHRDRREKYFLIAVERTAIKKNPIASQITRAPRRPAKSGISKKIAQATISGTAASG
jgi:hypothetical protein